MQGRNRQCRALAAHSRRRTWLRRCQPRPLQTRQPRLAHRPHQAARRTPGHLLPGLWWAASVVASLGVSLVRPSAATLAGRLAALLAASAAAISAVLLVLRLAAGLALLLVLRWELRQPQLRHPQRPRRPPQQPVQGLALPQALLVVPQRVQRRALVPGRLAALLLAQRLVRLFQASERLLALASV